MMVAMFILQDCFDKEFDDEGTDPGYKALKSDDGGCPLHTEFATYGCYGCYAWGVEQAEDEEHVASGGGEEVKECVGVGEEYSKGGHDAFLCHES